MNNFYYQFQSFILVILHSFRTSNFDEAFARVGIATYGYLDNAGIYKFPKLKPVMSLWANKTFNKRVKKGQSVGYGGKFTANEDMTVSTYDIGYGDGFLRLNEKKFIHNSKRIQKF